MSIGDWADCVGCVEPIDSDWPVVVEDSSSVMAPVPLGTVEPIGDDVEDEKDGGEDDGGDEKDGGDDEVTVGDDAPTKEGFSTFGSCGNTAYMPIVAFPCSSTDKSCRATAR